MRTLIRTASIAALITVAGLVSWYFARQSFFSGSAKAASAPTLPVPSYCIPPEMAGLQELMTRTTNPKGQELLLVKVNAAEQAALNCAANATAYPPAPKPSTIIWPPTSIPLPTPTLQVGLQHDVLGPVGSFLPTEDGYNLWAGFVKGQAVEVGAGSIDDPYWQNHPGLPVQGALRVIINFDGLKGITYPTPSQHGVVQLIAACGDILVLQATDSTVFSFDVSQLAYVSNTSSCPAPTP